MLHMNWRTKGID